MIRSRPGGGPFARSRCPFDDEGEECERPFCPFFHPFSGASNPFVKVKEEVQDDDIIVVHEKVGPSRSAWPSSSKESLVVSNTVETHQPMVSEASMLHKENPVIDQYSCGYLGYVAPTSTDCETNNLASPSVYGSSVIEHIQGSENQCTSNLLPKNPSLSNTLSTGIERSSTHKPHDKNRKNKRVISAPSYTPTPIVQLEREEEERKKRRELAERQKNIRDRLKQQNLVRSSQNDEKEIAGKIDTIDPIDQILATQENLLKDQRDQKLEDLAKMEIEKKKHKERLEKQNELKKKKKGIKLKSGDTCCGPILAGVPPKIKEKHPGHQDLKEKDDINAKLDEDVWLGKKRAEEVMEEHEKKVGNWKAKTQTSTEKSTNENKTVIENILSTKRKQHSDSGTRNGFGNASKKLGFYKIMDGEKRKSKSKEKCDLGINENLKMISDIDKTIGALEEELRQSSSKTSQPSSSSFGNNKSLNIKKNDQEKKRVPIWRQKSNAPTDIKLENKLNNARKSSDEIINSLFEGDDLPVEGSTTKPNKFDNKKLKLDSISLVHKRRRTSSSSERNKKKSKQEDEEDQETLKEKQALVDLLSDDDIIPLSSKVEDNDTQNKVEKNKTASNNISISSNKAIPSNLFEPLKLLTPTASFASSSSISVVPATPSPIASPSHKSSSAVQKNTIITDIQDVSKSKALIAKKVAPTAQEQLHSRTLLSINQSSDDTYKVSAEVRKNVSTESSSKQNNFQRKLQPSSSNNTHFNNSFTCQSSIPLTVSSNLNSSLSTSKQTLPSTLKKGEQRKAHLSIPSKAEQQKLVPLDPNNRKVALQLRQTKLKIIHAEYVKICVNDPKMAIESAQHEEKEVLDRCSTKIGYISAIPNVIKRLRNFVANNENARKGSDSISHQNVLLGRHADSVTVGLQKAKRFAQHKASHLSESDFYNELEVYILSNDQLWENGYPRWTTLTQEIDDDFDSSDERPRNIVEIRQSELDSSKGHSKSFISDDDLKRVCSRCGIEYQLKPNGDYVSSEECIYHWGRAWKKKIQGVVEARYTCCQSTLDVRGCVVAGRHITQTLKLSTLEQYVSTPKPYGVGDPRSTKVYAMDCEMVYSNWGPEVARQVK
uniref:Elongin A binding-protein 1 domain-containing protein n=1 Tax=Meloidogyne incognita TaxID=6306 RepID=A0A914M3E1_MELIC